MLTAEQEIKIQKVASSGLCKFLRGSATVLDYTGTGIHLGTTLVADGLHAVANGVETVGERTDTALKSGAETLREKAEEFDLSDISEEDMLKAVQSEAVVAPI